MKRQRLQRTSRFWRKTVSIGVGLLVIFTCVQLYSLHRMDVFFGSSALPSSKPMNASKTVVKPTPKPETVPVPANAKLYAYGSDKTEIAYTTSNQQLMIANAKKTVYQQTVGPVTKLQWLGDSGTLLYFVQNTGLNAYLLEQNQQKPVLIDQWNGTNQTVKNIYFSPYLEYMYIELEQGGYDQVYKYDAVIGMKQLALGYIKIAHIQYNAKQDIMTITDSVGTVWHYENDELSR
jgi:hypothetical protein